MNIHYLAKATRMALAAVCIQLPTLAHAIEGNVQFAGAAVEPQSPSTISQQPGFNRVIMPLASSEEAARIIGSRRLPADLVQTVSDTEPQMTAMALGSAPVGPASIAELARALKNDPDLIYEYVRNNAEYVPMWGLHKGAVGTILDNQGTAFDQASLMVTLLRQAGITASYVQGRIRLNAAQVRDWLGVDTANTCAVLNLLANGQIPVASANASTGVTCPGPAVALQDVTLDHIWVRATIGGSNYVFDPSFKPHTLKTGVNLATATGFNATNFLTSARTGATITADYAQGINRTNIHNSLKTYATNLANYLRTNRPAGSLVDAVGGMEIVPHGGEKLRQATLPYQDTSYTPTVWTGDIPANYKAALNIRYQNIDKTFTSDAIYGKRLTITYNSSNQPVLMLDGVNVATGLAITPGNSSDIIFSVSHPYASPFANQTFYQSIKAGGTYLVNNGWGPVGRGLVELYRSRMEEAKAAGNADSSEPVLGSSLAVLGATWVGQLNQAGFIDDRLANTTTLYHHQVGIVGYNGAAYVDLPGNQLSVVSKTADKAKEDAAFFNGALRASVLESTAVQQVTGVSAVSTVKLLDIIAAGNERIYDARSANFASAVQPNLVSCAPYMSAFQGAIGAGHRLILPARCNIAENSWRGVGYFDVITTATGSGIGALINGGMLGGFSSTPQPVTQTVANTSVNTVSTESLTQSTGSSFGDPIDMANGHFLYSHNDITTGIGAFPLSLGFEKIYSSGRRLQDGPLGKGWTHNLSSSVSEGSDGFQTLGEDSALDAASSIAEAYVSLALLADTAKPLDKFIISTLGKRWLGDQLTFNTVIVRQGLNGEVFVKLPDGTYNASPGNSAKLTRNADNTYSYETVNRAKLNFNSAGKIADYTHNSGVQVKFAYTGNDLSGVSNSLGRSLSITNTAGRISEVVDGARVVKYVYDGSGNLATFTETLAKNTTFQYDVPGRMTKLFYPAKPTVAFLTNTYDSLGRVKTQTNANGKIYNYYFAGSRSEEVGPGNISRVSYLDDHGKVLKAIDPLGRITLNAYDAQTRLTSTTLPEGNRVTYVYDDATCAAQKRCTHNVKTVSQIPKPGSTLPTLSTGFTYEASFNKVSSTTDPRGKVTNYSYTAQGNPLTVASPADTAGVRPATTYGYKSFTPAGFPVFYLQSSETSKITSSASVITTTTYNVANKYVPATRIVDSGTGKLNITTAFTYDAVGNLTQINGPRTDVTDTQNYLYDAERQAYQSTDALGKLTRIAYDADGRVERRAVQSGTQWLVVCNTYTNSGKLLRTWGPALTAADTTCPAQTAPVPVTAYAYDDLDRLARVAEVLTSAQGGNRVTETVYNADNRVANVKRAVGSTVAQTYATYTYSLNGLPATVKDAKNNLTTYQYDGHDRKIKVLFPHKTTVNTSSTTDFEQFDYDANSNLISHRKRNANTVTFAYDNINRLTSRTYPTAANNVSYSYDLLGRRLTASHVGYPLGYVWDNASRLRSAAAGGKAMTYQYDLAGNRTRTTWPETAFYVTTVYDALNRPSAIKELGTSDLATYAYDDLSRRTTITRGNTSTTTTYGYNTSQGTLASLNHNLAGTAQDNTWTFSRNQVREITGHSWTNDLYQWTGYTNGVRTYTANGLNQYTVAAGKTLTHDSNGNLAGDGSWTFKYDVDNQLISASKTGVSATLAYDPAGRLRRTTIGGTVTDLVYDGDSLVAEYDSTGNVLRRYVHGPGLDEPLVWYEGNVTTNKLWLYADHLGSVVATANASGTSTATYTYGPYGEPNVTTGSRFRYTGQQYLGPLNLYYYKARFYSPWTGRFLQTDPIGYADSFNLYAYVTNNPMNFTDSSGLAADSQTSNSFGAIGVGAIGVGAIGRGVVSSLIATDVSIPDPTDVAWPKWAVYGAVVGIAAGAGWLVHSSDDSEDGPKTLQPGPHAGDSVPARGPGRDFTPGEREKINEIGNETGCHTCGATEAGTSTGNFIPDHQPPNALNPEGNPQELYPHCLHCSRVQGGEVNAAKNGGGS